jgi:hypothetical protein
VENADRAKFCSECGAPLRVAVAEQRERRVVSTLFADLAGFTRRSESLDVGEVEAFLDPSSIISCGSYVAASHWYTTTPPRRSKTRPV